MKDKIIMLIVGIVIGVVLAGVCFWFATSVTGGTRGEMPSDMQRGEMRQDGDFDANNIKKDTNTSTNTTQNNT